MMRYNWIRWLGSVAAAGALFIVVMSGDGLGTRPRDFDIILHLGLAVLSCYVAVFLLAFGRRATDDRSSPSCK